MSKSQENVLDFERPHTTISALLSNKHYDLLIRLRDHYRLKAIEQTDKAILKSKSENEKTELLIRRKRLEEPTTKLVSQREVIEDALVLLAKKLKIEL